MTEKLIDFDMSEYLDSEEAIAEYISQVLKEGDSDEFLRALGYIAKARGMTQIAKNAGLSRESLYKALRKGTKPRFDTIMKVLNALNIKLQISVSKSQIENKNIEV